MSSNHVINEISSCVVLPHYDLHPLVIFKELSKYESNKNELRDDIFKIIKLYMKHRNNVFDFTADTDVSHLIGKYHIKMHPKDFSSITMPRIIYTYPIITFAIMKINECASLPVEITEMEDFVDFKSEYRTGAIFALIPHSGSYGGFIKALLHYLFLETQIIYKREVEDKSEADLMQSVINFAKIVYSAPLVKESQKRRFMETHPITFAMNQQWHDAFNAKYPIHVHVHMEQFDQNS